jgi:hypothetical protein
METIQEKIDNIVNINKYRDNKKAFDIGLFNVLVKDLADSIVRTGDNETYLKMIPVNLRRTVMSEVYIKHHIKDIPPIVQKPMKIKKIVSKKPKKTKQPIEEGNDTQTYKSSKLMNWMIDD